MICQIEWEPDIPDEIKEAIDPFLTEFLWLLPPWLQSLTLGYRCRQTDDAAITTVNKSYRWAVVTIGSPYLLYNNEERRDAIIHEILHMVQAPLQHVVERLLKGDEESFEYKTYRDALECVITDLAYLINKKM